MPTQKTLDKQNKRLDEKSQKEYDDYIERIKEKNKRYLLKLTNNEKKRIVDTVLDDWYKVDLTHHQDICDNIDKYDEQWRMTRKTVKGTDKAPNYRQGLATVILEVIHANIMKVFFAQKDILTALPTEPNDAEKIPKLNTFMNWSMLNEMKIFQRCDRLFHNSGKVGDSCYKEYWTKEYGMVTKKRPVPNPFNPGEPLIDPKTKEVLQQEFDEPKLLYDGPKLDVFSRKDWIIPENSTTDNKPHHEIHRMRKHKDEILRKMEEGKYYDDIVNPADESKPQIKWGAGTLLQDNKKDRESKDIPLGKNEKTVFEAYGGFVLKEEDDESESTELEEEYIFTICLEDRVLMAARKNKFPLKMRPIGLCPFIPDDEGRIDGLGIMEFMEDLQQEYDALHNQALKSTVLQNEPILIMSPVGNRKTEPQKVQAGYVYYSSDPASAKIFQFPGPSQQMFAFMKIVLDWSEKMFPMGEYAAGKISEIDPDAPARKVERILEQINTRLNLIVKRFNNVLKDIFLRHYLLYEANCPPNKFMRIAGEGKNPWKFDSMKISDFSLKSLPDFELTGNILSSNKVLEARKATVVYDRIIGQQNIMFSPQNPGGAQAYYQITKWWLDKMDALGVAKFMPEPQGQYISTPEEENAKMVQGDVIEPDEREPHQEHIRKHLRLVIDQSLPVEVRQIAMTHIQKTYKLFQTQMAKEMMFGREAMGGQRPEETVGAGARVPQPVGRPGEVGVRGGPPVVGAEGIR